MEQNIEWHTRCRERERQRKIGLCEYFEKTNAGLREEIKKVKHENRKLRGQIRKENNALSKSFGKWPGDETDEELWKASDKV